MSGSSASRDALRRFLVALQITLMVATLFAPVPALAADPSADPSPAPSAEPSPTPTPDVTPPADATPTPDSTPTPDATPTPDSTPTPDATPTPDSTPTPEPSPTPTPAAELATEPYIVTFVSGVAASDQDAVLASVGAVETGSIPQLRMRTILLPPSTEAASVAALRGDSRVARVDADRVRIAEAAPSDALYAGQWSLPKVGWDQVYGTVTPAGSASVAILDTGVDASHPDLAGNVLPGTSILDGSNGLTDPNGHGTWMAGIVAAQTDNGQGIAGVGYAGVKVLPVTVLGADGTGQDSDVIAGVVWAVDHGANVILMAFSSGSYSASLQAAVDFAWSNGVVLVAATGNDGSSAAAFPAGDRGVIGVSNTDQNDALNASSNYGQDTFLAAPGTDIETTDAGGGYSAVTGTSASAAEVAAAAALVKAVDPSASNGVIVGRLARNADAAGTVDQTGNGRLNLARALADTSTGAIEPAGAAPVGSGGPFVGPYVAAATTGADGWRTTGSWSGSINSASSYSGGDSVPIRFTDAAETQGSHHVLTLKYDFSFGTKRFVDFIDSFDQTINAPAPDPCTGLTCANKQTWAIPADGTLGFTQTAGVLTTWNVTNLTFGSYTLSSGVKQIAITFDVVSGGGNKDVVLAWGAHLARENEWGTGNGASSFTGASQKVSGSLDGASDKQVSINPTLTPKADLQVLKTAPAAVNAGSNLTWSITVNDLGPDQATAANITDTLPSGTTFVSVTPSQGTCSGTSTVSCTLGAINAGASATVTLVATVAATTANGTQITNTASVSSSAPTDPVGGNNSGSATTTVTGRADIGIAKTDSPDPVVAGNNLTYTITATNNSTASTGTTAAGVTVSDTIPSGTTFVSATPSQGSCSGTSTVTCNLGTLAIGASATVTLVVTVAASTTDGTVLSNTATATTTTFDPTTPNSATATTTVNATRSLLLTKSALPATYSTVGQTITYTYTIKNTGNVTLAGPFSVSDDKQGTISPCGSGPLAPNASTSCTSTHTISQADLDAGSITNTATASGNSVTSNQAQATVTASQTRSLLLTKAASPATYSTVGQTITYTYTIKNTGNVTLAGPFSVSDDKQGTISPCGSGPLAPNASTSCTSTHTISQADLDAGSITNTATASGNSVTSNQAQATVTASQTKSLTIDKTASELTYSAVGNVLHYHYKLTNSGNVTLAGPFVVSDDLAADEACPATASLAPGAFITCSASYTVTQADLDAGTVTNHAFATASFNSAPVTSNTATLMIFATQTRSLLLTKSALPATYSTVGQTITYTYTIKNTGNVTLAGPFSVSDDKQGTISPCGSGPLAPNASTSCTSTHTISQADLDAGSITNTATASGNSVTSNQAQATVTASQTRSLLLTKAASPATYSTVGQTITYTYTIKNTGNVTLAGPFSVSDDKQGTISPCGSGPLAPNASTSCTSTHTISQADLDAGSITNTATASGNSVTSNQAQATVTASQTKSLTIDKTASELTYSAVGNVLHYHYKLTNSGNVTLAGPFVVSDDLAADEACPATASLAPGAFITCSASYTVTQADLDAGSVTNHAFATASFNSAPVTSNTASLMIFATQTKSLTIDKTASELTYSAVGNVLHYHYKLTNSGNVTLAGPFVVSDDLAADEACPATASLAPGAFITCSASYTVTQADLDAGTVTNHAFATASFNSAPVTSNTATLMIFATQTKSLLLTKSALPATYSTVGQTITYTYTIKNTGNVTLAGPFSVSDDKQGTISPCGSGPLAPNASTSCTSTHTISQADLDAGSITNTATASGNSVTSNQAQATVTASQTRSLLLTKAASPATYSTVGQTITYTYTIKNTGNVTLAGPFSVSDDKQGTISPCGSGPLAPNASTSCTSTHTISQADLDAGSITNTATASGNSVTSNQAQATVTASQTKSLTIDKTASELTYSAVGNVLHYHYKLTNSGNVTLAGPFVVSDDLAADEACPATASLAPGAFITCSASYTVTQADLDAGTVTNHAFATASFNSAPVTSNTATLMIFATQTKSLTVDKSSATTSLSAPATVTYSYLVTNTGNVTLTGIGLSDDNTDAAPVCLASTLAPGGTTTCSAQHTFSQAELDAGGSPTAGSGNLSNTVTASSDQGAGDTDSLDIPISQTKSLTVDKSSATTSLSAPATVTYSYLVTNTGNVTLTGIGLSDDNTDAGPVCLASTLAPGGTTTCSAQHTFSQAELDAGGSPTAGSGNLSNTVTASSDQGAGDTDSLDIPISQTKSLTVDKSSATTSLSAPATVTYSYLVTNTGNVTLTGIGLSDDNTDAAPVCLASTLAPGGTTTCSAQHTFSQAELDAGGSPTAGSGNLSNTVTASSDQGAGDTDSLDIPISQTKSLTVDKSSATTSLSAPATVTYSYLVTNTGNVTLTGIGLVDDNTDAVPVCLASTLAPGGTTTCSAQHTFSQAELDAGGSPTAGSGNLSNTVTASSDQGAGDTDSLDIPISQTRSLTVDKSSATTSLSAPATVTYSYLVTNTGNVTLTGIGLSDDNTDAAPVCLASTLAPGGTTTCSAQHTFSQAELDAGGSPTAGSGNLSNTVTASSDQGAGDTDSLDIPISQTPSMTVDKSSATTSLSAPATVTYSYLVTNTGNVTLTGIGLVDDNTDAVPVCLASTLAPGGTTTCSAQHTFSQAELDAGGSPTAGSGNLSNTVTASSDQGAGDTDSLDIPISQSPALSLAKSITGGDPYSTVGATVSYQYVVTNTGNVTISSVSVGDDNTDAAPVCDVTTLAPTASATCTAGHTVTQADLDAGFVTNQASATGTPAGGDLTDPTASATAHASQSPALSLDKTTTTTTYNSVGDSLSYSYQLTNTGNVTLAGPFTVSDDQTTVSCPSDTSLAPAASLTCSATYSVTQADLDAGFVTNTATGHASFSPYLGSPSAVDSNQDSTTVNATQTPSVSIDKSSIDSSYDSVGDVLHYSYLVTNTGNVTLAGPFTVSDDRASDELCPATASLAPGASITCSATYTVSQADLDAGFVTNTATAAGSFTLFGDNSPETITSDPDSVTIEAIQSPALSLDKTTTTTTYNSVGDSLSYSYQLTNTGNVTLAGPFTVSDDQTTVSCPSDTSLAPTASITCSATYSVTQADLDAGFVTNTATGHASFSPYLGSPSAVDSNQDSTTVNATQTPSVSIDKSSIDSSYDSVGDVLHYSYLVTNTGNVTLAGPFTVSDDRASDELCPATASLAPGASITCSATYTVSQADLDAGFVTNTATAAGSFTLFGDNSPETITSDPDSVTIEAIQSPALSLDKTTTTTTYNSVGDSLSYSYQLTNTGNVTLAGPFTVSDDQTTVSCPSDTSLAPTASITCSATYSVTQADLDAGFVTNTATGHASFSPYLGSPSAVDSNQDSTTVNATQTPSVSIDKSSIDSSYDSVGDVLHYSYLVTNTGNVTLAGPFTVSDDRASDELCPATASLAPGASITCSATYTVSQADLDAGFVTNTATAAGSFTLFGDNSPETITSDPDSVTIEAIQSPALSLDKTTTTTTYNSVGDSLSYSYQLTNTGNVTLAGPFTVSDDQTTVSCPSDTSLAPAASLTCSATYSVTQADLDAGFVTNTATGHASFSPYLGSPSAVDSNQDSTTVNATQTPSVSIDKSSIDSSYDSVGDVLHYSYLVTNTGNVTLAGPFTVSDDRASDELCPATASLAPGASITCSATYTVSQADLDAGFVTNTATAAGSFTLFGDNSPETITSDPDSVTIEAIQSPALSLDKTTTTTTYNSVGDSLSYSYQLTNTGNVTLAGPFTVSDDQTTVSCPSDTSLAPAASLTCSATYSVTQADLDAGFVTNTATGHASFSPYLGSPSAVDSNQDSTTVNATQSPALSLDKTITGGDPYSTVGATVSYQYVVTNTGNVTISSVSVSDDNTDAAPVCDVTTLAPTASATCTAGHTVDQADLDAGFVTNQASATGTPAGGDLTDPTASATAHASQSPALSLDKTTTTTTYNSVGDSLSYSYQLTNTGNVTLAGPFTVSDDQTTVSCPSDTSLAPTASITCSATYSITQADLDAGFVTNTATGHASFSPYLGSPSAVDSNQDSTTVNATQSPALSLDKTITGGDPYSTVGATVSYQYVVTNTGNVTISSVSVSDDNTDAAPVCDVTTLAPTASATCTAGHTVDQADLDAGFVTNQASATGTPAGGDLTDPTASATAHASQSPALSLDKTTTTTTYNSVGDSLSYSYQLTNTGNVTLAGPFTVSDDQTTVSCPSDTSLAPAASLTCSATYSVTQADLDAGFVTNSATAAGSFTLFGDHTPTPITSDSDSVTIEATQSPALTLAKSTTSATYAAPGDVLSYSYKLTNSGNVTLAGPFTVSDDKTTVSCPATLSLAPTASITCSATYTVSQADLDSGFVTNTATGHASFTRHGELSPTAVASNDDSTTVNATQSPSLSLAKTISSGDPYSTAGATIDYGYLVKNTGNVTISAVAVSDDNVAAAPVCDVTTLSPGASAHCTAAHTVSQADLDAGVVTNHASATGTPAGGSFTDPTASATAHATQSPALTLAKSTTSATYAAPGDTLSYSYKLTNSGNVTLAGPFTVSDDKTTVSCPATLSLAPAAWITCSATYGVGQADLDAGFVTNTATGHASFTRHGELAPTAVDSNDDSTTVNATQSPSLSLHKSSANGPYDAVGQTLAYTYDLKNVGNVTLGGPFTITDDRATNATCPATPSLAPGASMVCSGSYSVTQADLDSGSVANIATGAGKFGDATIKSNADTVTIHANQKPALSLDKTSAQSSYNAASQTLNYTYKLTNVGNVTLSKPASVSDTNVTAQPAYDSGDANNNNKLDVGETWIYLATHDVTQDDVDNGAVTNNALGHAVFGSTTVDSNPASLTIHGAQTIGMDLTKTVAETTYTAVGQHLHYTYTLDNSGNVSLESATVSDTNVDAAPTYYSGDTDGDGKLDWNEIWTFTAQHTVTLADINAGSITNNATGHATFHGNPVTSNTATKTIGATAADLAITKTSSASWVYVDNSMTYTVTIKNNGPSTATNVVVNDPLPSGTVFESASSTQGSCDITVTCSIGSVAKGATVTITIVVHQTQADFFTNKATVTASESDQDSTNNMAMVVTEARVRPTTLVYTGATTGDYHDAATVSAKLTDNTASNAAIVNKLVTFKLNGLENCSGTTNASGIASCLITPNEAAGPYTVTADFAGDTKYAHSATSTPFAVTREQTTTTYTGASGPILNGSTVTLSGSLKEDGVSPIAGRTLTLTLGTQSCTGTTNGSGSASCNIVVSQPLGPMTASATFAGDAYYLPSSDTRPATTYASVPGGTGAFVIGDQSATGSVTFWDSQWWSSSNKVSGGAQSSFKGFAKFPSAPTCGSTFSTDPGNSAPPPAGPLPAYMSVIVTSKVTKSGSTISGTILSIVIVRTNSGYDSNPGHPGSGTVVAIVC